MARKETYLTNQFLGELDYTELLQKVKDYGSIYVATTLLMQKAFDKKQLEIVEDLRVIAQTMLNTSQQIDIFIQDKIEYDSKKHN